jgi:CubicO group peptidase (beta-lactamase class C family)
MCSQSKIGVGVKGMKNSMDYSLLQKRAESLIEKKLKNYKVTGCSIALIDGNETVWSQGFGYADKENAIAATTETPYLIGSTTKVFTGTAIMQLVEQGKVNIDKPIQEYIPELKYKTRFPDAPPITVQSLMTHHSGLPCDNFKEFYNENPNDNSNTFRSVVDYLNEHYSSYPPNYIWSYSNLGTALLGIIIERASGMNYCEYIKENIFNPLKMTNSSFVIDKGARDSMAKPYNKGVLGQEHFLRDLPAGSIISTASDMASFIKMVLLKGTYENSEILKENTLEQMLIPQNQGVALDSGFKMGLSWMLEWPFFDYAGKVCWHDGSSIHYNSLMVALPEQQLGVILMSNSSTALPAFLREVAEEILINAIEIKSEIRPRENTKNDVCTLSKEHYSKYTGTYASIMGLIDIKENNNKLKINMSGMNFDMIHNQDGWFSLKYSLFGVIPLNLKKLENIRVNVFDINAKRVFALEQGVSRHAFKQNIGIEYSVKNIPEVWRKRIGKYEAIEKENSFFNRINLSYVRGVLLIKVSARKLGKLNIILNVISDSEAIVMGLGRYAGDTVTSRNENGHEILELLGLKFVRVK